MVPVGAVVKSRAGERSPSAAVGNRFSIYTVKL